MIQSPSQRAQAARRTDEKIENGGKAERIGKKGRKGTDQEGNVQKAHQTVEALVKVRLKGPTPYPPFLTMLMGR